MNPFKLFNPDYLLDITPGDSFLYGWPLMILFVLCFALSWKVKHHLAKKNSHFHGIPERMREFAVAGIILTFLRAENIPYLGMRLWLVLLLLGALIYAAWLWKGYEDPNGEVMQKKEAYKDPYKPQAKKKRNRKRK